MIWIWIGFIVMVLGFLALDLGVFNKTEHVISTSEALIWTALWIILALAFNAFIFEMYSQHWLGIGQAFGHPLSGKDAALQFFTGYIVEKSLSLDNIFVIAVIFNYYSVPPLYQHRVLFWGILGALILRGAMIALGAALVQSFSWINYVFGGILIITAIKMLITGDDKIEPEKTLLVKTARKLVPVTKDYEGHSFFTKLNGKFAITPLFLVLLFVEGTDLLFAVDSIPAIFAITKDPFLVFTSNVFAILGLRSLFFALAGIMDQFRYLKVSLVFVLIFVGVKMIISQYEHIPIGWSLAIIAGILGAGVVASILATHKDTKHVVKPVFDQVGMVADATIKQIRRAFIFLIGATVIAIGIVMIVAPGPAIVVIPAGLAILGSEFVWAKKLLHKLKEKTQAAGKALGLPFGKGKGDASDEERAQSVSDSKS